MKIGKAKVDGKEYLLCFTPRVLKNLQDRTGHTLAEELKAIEENFDISSFIDLLQDMLVAGDTYASKNGIEHNPAPNKDDLYDLIGFDDFTTMFGAVIEATKLGTTPDIETETPKNAEATQKEITE